MSKKKLIELIKMDGRLVRQFLDNVGVDEFRGLLLQALKDQDRGTRHGCAEAVNESTQKSEAHAACMNYRDKDLEGL